MSAPEETPEQPPEQKKKSDLGPRVITAVVAVPILLGFIFLAPHWAFFLLIASAGAISAWEYANITNGDGPAKAPWLVAALTFGVMNALYFAPTHAPIALCAAALTVYLYYLFNYRDQAQSAGRMGSAIAAMIHGGLLLSCLALVRRHTGDSGPFWVILALGSVWGSDTGAYFAGKKFGRRKLYEAVSPNKTIEGALGSMIAGFLITVIFGLSFTLVGEGSTFEALGQTYTLTWKPLEWWHFFVLAIPVNVLGQTGDLTESLIKRAHGVKDSGTIIYGHGGMLDRIDALIFAAPWFYLFVHYIQG